mgnify:CR=1 FL=1
MLSLVLYYNLSGVFVLSQLVDLHQCNQKFLQTYAQRNPIEYCHLSQAIMALYTHISLG